MTVYTLGYQGISLDKYIEILLSFGVGIVLDVRETPWSFKRGFTKAEMEKNLNKAGISYIHLRSAGNPSTNRKTAQSPEECLGRYKIYLKAHPECLQHLLSYIDEANKMGKPACLTCYEQIPSQCHRSILIEHLLLKEPGLTVIHLGLNQKIKNLSSQINFLDQI